MHAPDTPGRVSVDESATAQQPANQPPAGPALADALIGGAAGAAIGAEGQLKATMLVFQDGKIAAEYHYYWWRGRCYARFYQSDNYGPARCMFLTALQSPALGEKTRNRSDATRELPFLGNTLTSVRGTQQN